MPTETKRCVSAEQAKIQINEEMITLLGEDYRKNSRIAYQFVTKNEDGTFEYKDITIKNQNASFDTQDNNEVDELDETERGEGGFGSTGKQ
jgi:dUTPase